MDYDALIRPWVHPMVPYAPGLRARDVRERSGRSVVRKLSSNESPHGPFPSAIAGMRSVLPHLNRYPDGSSRALKRALSETLSIDERYFMIGNGSNELLVMIAQTVLSDHDEVLFAWPSFVVYPMCAQLTGAKAVTARLTSGHVHDLPAMLQAITPKTKIVFLCNPNNPTGTVYERKAFEEFLDAVPDHVLIVVDEAYFEYVTSESSPNGLDYFDGKRPLVVLRTFSKMYSLAGVRVGYGIAPQPLVEAINKVRAPFNVSSVAQVAAYYSLEDHAEVARRREVNREQRERLCLGLDRLGIPYAPSQANFVYVLTDEPTDIFEVLLAEGIIVRDFGDAAALRVGIGTPEDTEATLAAFEMMSSRGSGQAG